MMSRLLGSLGFVTLVVSLQTAPADLVLIDGQLAAVMARLDADANDPEFKGRWHLEAGFGHCDVPGTHVFPTLDEAGAWVQGQVNRA